MHSRQRSKLLTVVCVVVFLIIYKSHLPFGRQVRTTRKALLDNELKLNKNWRKDGLNFQSQMPYHDDNLPFLEQQLKLAIPYEPHKPFPKNIWQTWKVDVDDNAFPGRFKTFQETWISKNPDYNHYVITDEQCDTMVEHLYEHVPDVVVAWHLLPKLILKADFFRYLILFARGGVYSDIDTQCLKPIDLWVSGNDKLYKKANHAGLVIGIEADPNRPDWAEWYARRIQFCQWTIQAKKGHPMLRMLVADVTRITLRRKAEDTLDKTVGKDTGGDIMNWTGPGVFTDTVFHYLNGLFGGAGNTIRWQLFANLETPMVVEDVMVLPITLFLPGVGQMGAKSSQDPLAYVQHMFLGSWKHLQ